MVENPKRTPGPGEVLGKVPEAAFALLRKAGVPTGELTAGLSFDERSLRRKRRVPWDDYCILLERAEAAVGGPERLDDLVRSSYHSILPREIKALLGAFASPTLLYQFLVRVLTQSTFTTIKSSCRQLRGGSLRITARLIPGHRPCLTYMRVSVAALSGFVGHLGLPPAEVEVEELTPESLVVLVRLPDSRTLLARTVRAAKPAIHRSALRAMELLSWRSGDPDSAAPARRAPSQDRVRAAQSSMGLTVRQAEVLAQLILGRSNKEIASELDCAENTVEFHVTQLLRKAGVESRTQLVASLL